MLAAPTLFALDVLVFLHDLNVDHAIWVVAGAMVSAIFVAWTVLGDIADVVNLARQVVGGDLDRMPVIRSGPLRRLAGNVAQRDRQWRRQAEYFSQSITADMAILETLHDPLVFIGEDKRIVRANAAARTLFGSDMTGQSIDSALRLPDLVRTVARTLATKTEITLDLEWPGPVPRTFEVRVLPIEAPAAMEPPHDLEEAALRFSAVLTLHETTELRRAVALQERFIADVSHELRTPLSSIIGFIETIEGPAAGDTDAQARFLEIMHAQATRMARIVSDLLSLSRAEQKENEPLRQMIDLAELLHEVATGLDLNAMQRGMMIDVRVEHGLEFVRGDRDQLFQVFQNLIDNAIKYGKADTSVEVEAAMRGDGIVIAVRDHGQGIPPEHLPHLGERFYRADSGRSRQTGGSGLGLAIVQNILNRHGGRLGIESTPGEGSLFTVQLPRIQGHQDSVSFRQSHESGSLHYQSLQD